MKHDAIHIGGAHEKFGFSTAFLLGWDWRIRWLGGRLS